MKNTVYALARQDPIDHVEAFALRLADHFAGKPAVSRVRISARRSIRWEPPVGRRPPASARVRAGRRRAMDGASSRATRAAAEVVSGLTNLVVLKTDRLGVLRFSARRVHDAARDRGSHPGDVGHRGVDLSAGRAGFRARATGSARRSSRRSPRTTAVRCSTRSTRWARRRSRRAPTSPTITLTMPNRHHLLVDLEPFGLDNPNEIFVATDQPFGLIEATIRDDGRISICTSLPGSSHEGEVL